MVQLAVAQWPTVGRTSVIWDKFQMLECQPFEDRGSKSQMAAGKEELTKDKGLLAKKLLNLNEIIKL
jgi:hypothetical protein